MLDRRAIGSTGAWLEQIGCLNDTAPVLDTDTSVVLVTPNRVLQGGFEYRVRLVQDATNTLKCNLVTGTPAVPDYSPEYTFTICELCEGDADNNAVVNFADQTEVLQSWGSTDCLKDGDADRDGDVDFADITAVLRNFNETCCSGESVMSGSGPSLDSAAQSLGFANLEGFIAELETLPFDKQVVLLNELMSAAGAGGSEQ